MINKTFTIRLTVPTQVASSLGGRQLPSKNMAKVDRERVYFLRALINRGAEVLSEVEAPEAVDTAAEQPAPEGWATVGGTEEPKAEPKAEPKPAKAHAKS